MHHIKQQSSSLESKEETGKDREVKIKLRANLCNKKASVLLSCKAMPGVQSEVKRTGYIEDVWKAM